MRTVMMLLLLFAIARDRHGSWHRYVLIAFVLLGLTIASWGQR